MFLWRHPQQILALRMTLVEYLWSSCLQWLLRLRLKGMSMNVEVVSIRSLQGLVVGFHPEDFASPEERSLLCFEICQTLLGFRCRNQLQQVEVECLEEVTGSVHAPGVFPAPGVHSLVHEVRKTWACRDAAESQCFLDYVSIYLALKVFDKFVDRYRSGHVQGWISVTGGGQCRGWFWNCCSRWGRSICRGRSSVVWGDVGRDWSWKYFYCRSHWGFVTPLWCPYLTARMTFT